MPHFPELLRRLPKFEGSIDATKLSAEDSDVLFASYPGGTRIPPHRHDTENVGVVTQGELLLTVAGEQRSYRPGDWYHIDAQAEHSAIFEQDSSIIEFWFKQR
jgi:mannose-6-phosphate isomerase-like protein (cupin superfamily)